MKKVVIFILLLSCAVYTQVPTATFTDNVRTTFQQVMTNLKYYFYQVFGYLPTTPAPVEQPTPVETQPLSPFQQFFRTTMNVTTQTKNILTTTAHFIIDQTKVQRLSAQQMSEQFINQLLTAHHQFITQALNETLHIDLNRLVPSLQAISEYTIRLQKAIAPLENVRLKKQVIELTEYLDRIQQNVSDLQHAGIIKVTAALTLKALTGAEQTLVTKFNEVYTTYPTLIERINNLKIAGPGKIMQSALNRASELIEQVITLHQSTGTIGTVLIPSDIIAPLDQIKNELRKLGNAIDFATVTKPLIVVAPPTTHEALFVLLKTFVFNEGMQIKDLIMQDITTLQNLLLTMNHKIELIKPVVTTLQNDTTNLASRIQDEFITAIKAAPLRTIPRAPMVLLEISESHIANLKKQLDLIVSKSALIIKNVSDMISTVAHFLPYVNQCMGATAEKPFVNPTIIRSLDFIAEDTNSISATIEAINEAIENHSVKIFSRP